MNPRGPYQQHQPYAQSGIPELGAVGQQPVQPVPFMPQAPYGQMHPDPYAQHPANSYAMPGPLPQVS